MPSDQGEKSEAYQVGVLLKADVLVTVLARYPNGLGLVELSERSGINKATCRRLLVTLQRLGYIHQEQVYENYALGLRWLELGSVVKRNLDVWREAMPHLKELGKRTEEVVFLYVFRGDEAFCVGIVEGQHVRARISVGDALPLYLGAAPRCMLASLPDSEIARILAQPLRCFTERSPRTADEIWQLIRDCRQYGYGLSYEDVHLGISAIGAPVFAADGGTVAAVSVSGVVPRLTPDREPELVRLVQETARRISHCLGFRGL